MALASSKPARAERVIAKAPTDLSRPARRRLDQIRAQLRSPEVWLALYDRRRAKREYTGALDALRQAEERTDTDPAGLRRVALDFQALKAYPESLRAFSKLVDRDGTAGAYDDRGVCRFQAGDSAGAESDFQAAIARDPAALEARLNLATILEASGRARQALDVLSVSGGPSGQAAAVRRWLETRQRLMRLLARPAAR